MVADRLLRVSRCIFPFIQRVFADSGYAGEKVAKATLIAVEIVRKNPNQVGFAVNPRRWVVERFFAWIGRNRRWDIASGSSTKIFQVGMTGHTDQQLPNGIYATTFSSDERFIGLGTSPSHYSVDYWTVTSPLVSRHLSLSANTTVNFGGIAFHPSGDEW
jgi:hypothetical protein